MKGKPADKGIYASATKSMRLSLQSGRENFCECEKSSSPKAHVRDATNTSCVKSSFSRAEALIQRRWWKFLSFSRFCNAKSRKKTVRSSEIAMRRCFWREISQDALYKVLNLSLLSAVNGVRLNGWTFVY